MHRTATEINDAPRHWPGHPTARNLRVGKHITSQPKAPTQPATARFCVFPASGPRPLEKRLHSSTPTAWPSGWSDQVTSVSPPVRCLVAQSLSQLAVDLAALTLKLCLEVETQRPTDDTIRRRPAHHGVVLPRLPRARARDPVAALGRAGFQVVRIKGSHHRLTAVPVTTSCGQLHRFRS